MPVPAAEEEVAPTYREVAEEGEAVVISAAEGAEEVPAAVVAVAEVPH
jgi:hypothetical protein